jgi:DNA segregation ATPase FtsK/SpoIIIE, S-DNA-T family
MLQSPIAGISSEETDDNFKQAVEVIVQYDRASASLLQRRLSIGYARAARLIDQLESAGVIAPAEGSAPRAVLIKSADEILGDNWVKPEKKDEWTPEPPKNYKVPSGVKLSRADDTPWGIQFADAFNDFKDSKIEFPIPIGFNDEGKLKLENLLDVNNLIIAGNTLSQKENFVDTILLTYLLRYDPSKLKIILIDPTRYLDLYNSIPHLLSPVINGYDKTISALKWAQAEMDRRLKQFSEAGIRDLGAYNEKSGFEGIPHILIVSFFDYFDVEREDAIIRLTAQGARTGIHNIIVVDRTSGASLPSMIKSNIPTRAVFKLTSAGESKAIGVKGAENLQQGELLYKPNFGDEVKLKAIFTPERNVKEIVEVIKKSILTFKENN